jgi:pyruvate formate lyase activating enzyme
LVPGFTDDKNDLLLLGNFIKKLKYMKRFDFLPYHKLALHKYKELGIKYQLANVKEPTTQSINYAKELVFGK